MCFCSRAMSLSLTCLLLVVTSVNADQAKDEATMALVKKTEEASVAAFNEGKVDELTAMFVPQGEFINDSGTVYEGEKEIRELFTEFFKKYPGAKLSLDIESVRFAGPVLIEEGTRGITTKDGSAKSEFRYVAVRTKVGDDWKIASFRDFPNDPAPTPHEYLEPLSFLIGEWINEGADGKVTISYRWSEDKNFILGEFQINSPTNPSSKSLQRIGWDPSVGKIRSWLFDNDGGFAEAVWTIVDDGVVIKTSSVNPDGSTATATLTLATTGEDRFSIKGTDRIVGESREPDFDVTVTRRPPTSDK